MYFQQGNFIKHKYVCTIDCCPRERFDEKVLKIVGGVEAGPRLGFEIDILFAIWVVFFCDH